MSPYFSASFTSAKCGCERANATNGTEPRKGITGGPSKP